MQRKKINDFQDIHDYDVMIASREIFLSIDDDMEVSHKTFMNTIKNIKILESYSTNPIVIHQITSGGCWDSGMALYDFLSFLKSPLIYITYGFAGSMGSILPQAAFGRGIRVSYPNCCWMLHEGHTSLEGTTKQFSALARINYLQTSQMYDIFANVCVGSPYFLTKSKSKIKAFFKNKLKTAEDWYINAYEALEYGLIDGIYGEEGFESLESIYEQL